MSINGVIVIWFFAVLFSIVISSKIALLLLIGFLVWYGYLTCYSKFFLKTPAKSRLFGKNSLEIHLGTKAKKSPSKFMSLFIDSIIWAKENDIKRAVLFTWYSKEKTFKDYFNDKAEITTPSFFEDFSNIYINPSYWFYNTGKKHLKVTIKVDQLTDNEINLLKNKNTRLKLRERK